VTRVLGALDLLLRQISPGTSDIAISLGQLIPRSEILVVTTHRLLPQEVAGAGRENCLSDEAAGNQCRREYVGESVSALRGEPIALFGSGGWAKTAKRLTSLVGSPVPLLAQVPF
jgi:ATP-binding protein involved in chromosome partitioning